MIMFKFLTSISIILRPLYKTRSEDINNSMRIMSFVTVFLNITSFVMLITKHFIFNFNTISTNNIPLAPFGGLVGVIFTFVLLFLMNSSSKKLTDIQRIKIYREVLKDQRSKKVLWVYLIASLTIPLIIIIF
jgi:uncharacterized membrane protein